MTTWKRKDVKTKGKKSFKENFWKCVATALILAIIGGGTAGAFGGGAGGGFGRKNDEHTISVVNEDHSIEIAPAEMISDSESEEEAVEIPTEALVAFVVIMSFAGLFILALALVIDAFIANPLELGCKRFFRRNLDEPASMGNITFAFDSNYKNICKTMFLRDIYLVLWSMLLVIPGIIKGYEYKLIPYLMSEDPSMATEEAFAESKRLMKGNKWRAFVLDLSFILWDLVSIFTCGIAGVFYVEPYKASTQAALYEAIRYGTASPAEATA